MSLTQAPLIAPPNFNAIYLASLHPALAALITDRYYVLDPDVSPQQPENDPVKAKALWQQAMATGLPIDTQIMRWGWSADIVMQMRAINGYAYVPAYGQPNINIAPGLSVPGVPSNYQGASIPPGAIKVSLDPADYPAYVDHNPPAAVPQVILIGDFQIFAKGDDGAMHYFFAVVPGHDAPIGSLFFQDGQYYKRTEVKSQEMMAYGVEEQVWQLM